MLSLLFIAWVGCARSYDPEYAVPRVSAVRESASPLHGVGVFGVLIVGSMGLTWLHRRVRARRVAPDQGEHVRSMGGALSRALPVAGLGVAPMPELPPDTPRFDDEDDGHVLRVEPPPRLPE